MTSFWCDTLLVNGVAVRSVRVISGATGEVAAITPGVSIQPGDRALSTVLPGIGNAHSHSFHRALRGRTHSDGGDFWQWRDAMYSIAGRLDPDLYYELARAVFAEMVVNGYTAVGEFHYLHHRPDGSRYPLGDGMEAALVAAARSIGIRLRLLDSAYLRGGVGQPLAPGQLRFGDASAAAWLNRFDTVRGTFGESTVGAAFHSVRAVPRAAMVEILAELGSSVPLHVHLSEQPRENAECLKEYGVTPTGLLNEIGALDSRLSVVHATHVTNNDIKLLGAAAVTVVMCPSTEADLGDGTGAAALLAGAGVSIALGSDQNAIIDPFIESRSLEYGARLASGARGRFSPPALVNALTSGGYRSLGFGTFGVGGPCDLVEVNAFSSRTIGSTADQLIFSATGTDVISVIVAGQQVAAHGVLAAGVDPADLLGRALAAIESRGEFVRSNEGRQ